MNSAKIAAGIVFVVMAAVAYGDVHRNKACFVYPTGTPGWNKYAPPTCVPWVPGCTEGDQEDGICTGVIKVKIDEGGTEMYNIMSCDNPTVYTINRCADFSEATCKDDGTLVCMTFRTWSNMDCTGEFGNKSVYSYKCSRPS